MIMKDMVYFKIFLQKFGLSFGPPGFFSSLVLNPGMKIENIATQLKSCKIFAILIQLEYHFITRGILSKDTLLCLKIIIKLPFSDLTP